MRGVLVDDDESILGLGDDEGVGELGPGRAERIGDARPVIGGAVSARVAARLGKRRKRSLPTLGKAE